MGFCSRAYSGLLTWLGNGHLADLDMEVWPLVHYNSCITLLWHLEGLLCLGGGAHGEGCEMGCSIQKMILGEDRECQRGGFKRYTDIREP